MIRSKNRGKNSFLSRVWLTFFAAAIVLAAAVGCTRAAGEAGMGEEDAYMLPEIMVIVATERNRYETVYTDQIWTVEVDEAGTTMKDMLLDQIRGFLEDMEVMRLLAESRGIELTASETSQVYRLAQEYYRTLSTGDLAFIGASEEEIQTLYERYCLANRLVNELTKDVNLEISDNEAKVITVQQIVVSSVDTAQDVYSQVTAEGADFGAIAEEYSEDVEIDRSLGRGEESESYEAAAFSLEDGQISQPVESEGKYYIIKCVNSYDEEATAIRKNQLSLARKNQAFRSIYDQFKEENPARISDELWSQVNFEGGEDCITTNFFDLYREYFPD